MNPICQVCEEEQHDPGPEFYDRECVCDKCWSEWEREKISQENEYKNSRI